MCMVFNMSIIFVMLQLLEDLNSREPASFLSGVPVFTADALKNSSGWYANQEKKGVLLVGNQDNRPIVFLRNHDVRIWFAPLFP